MTTTEKTIVSQNSPTHQSGSGLSYSSIPSDSSAWPST